MSAARFLRFLGVPVFCALSLTLQAGQVSASREEGKDPGQLPVLIGQWTCKATQKDGRHSARTDFAVEYRPDGSSAGVVELMLRFPGGKIKASYEYKSKWKLSGDKFWDTPLEVMSVTFETSGKRSGDGPSEIDLLDTLSAPNEAPYRLEVVSEKQVLFHVDGRGKPIRCRRN